MSKEKIFKIDTNLNQTHYFSADGNFFVYVVNGQVSFVSDDNLSKFPIEDRQYYKHDCKDCLFLKLFWHERELYDLYFCKSKKCVIVRYGNEPNEYISGVDFLDETIKEAERIATLIGLL